VSHAPSAYLGLQFQGVLARGLTQRRCGHDLGFTTWGVDADHVELDVVVENRMAQVELSCWANEVHNKRPGHGRNDVDDVAEAAACDNGVVHAPHRVSTAEYVALHKLTKQRRC